MFNEAKDNLCFKLDKKEYLLSRDEFCIGLVNDSLKGVFEYQNKFYKTKKMRASCPPIFLLLPIFTYSQTQLT